MANIGIAAGKAAGYSAATQGLADFSSSAQVASRAEARLRAEQSRQELRRVQATKLTDNDLTALSEQQSQQIQNLLEQTRHQGAELARRTAYEGFQRFDADGDAEHINRALADLRRDPIGRRLFDDTVRVDRITASDTDLLEQLGLTPEDLQEEPELSRLFLKATMTDGSVGVLPTELLYAGTLYDKYQLRQHLELMKTQSEIFRNRQARNAAAGSEAERIAHRMTMLQRPEGATDWAEGNPEYDAAFLENFAQAKQLGRSTNETELEAAARRETELQNPGTDDWEPGNPDYDRAYQNNFNSMVAQRQRTSAQKEQQAANEAKRAIDEIARQHGTDFFSESPSDPGFRRRYEDRIQEIMRFAKVNLSEEQKRTIRSARELIELGDIAKEMSPKETGLIDNMLRTVADYVFEEGADNTQLTSAYAAFRNTVRHALFGSTMTEGEIKAFNEQFGTINQQTGPILNRFKVGLQQVRSQLETIRDLNDSYVAHFYLGSDVEKVSDIIDALDQRIAFLNRKAANTSGSSDSVRVSDTMRSNAAPAAPAAPRVSDVAPAVSDEGLDPEVSAGLDSLFNDMFGE